MFPVRLRSLRKKRNLTMKQLGEKFSLAESTISGYENGNRKPDIEIVMKLADFFDVSIDYLLGRTEDHHGIIVHKQGSGKSGLTLEELKEELKKHNIDIYPYGGFEGFVDLTLEEQQFILQNVKNSIEMFKKMNEQNK